MGGFFRFRHWALGTMSSASWGTFQKSHVLTPSCFGCYLESLECHSLINMSDYWALILACWNSIRDSYTQGHSGLILHHEVIWNGKCPCVKKTAFLTHNKTTSIQEETSQKEGVKMWILREFEMSREFLITSLHSGPWSICLMVLSFLLAQSESEQNLDFSFVCSLIWFVFSWHIFKSYGKFVQLCSKLKETIKISRAQSHHIGMLINKSLLFLFVHLSKLPEYHISQALTSVLWLSLHFTEHFLQLTWCQSLLHAVIHSTALTLIIWRRRKKTISKVLCNWNGWKDN